MVEYAPFQKIPKVSSNRKDARCGTVDNDPDYLAFLDHLQKLENYTLPQMDSILEEIEALERENRGIFLH